MKVVLITDSVYGGAGIACVRLHRALRNIGVDSSIINLDSESKEEGIYSARNFFQKGNFLYRYWYKVRYHFLFRKNHAKLTDWRNPGGLFNFPVAVWPIHKHPLIRDADIINIHCYAEVLDFESFFDKQEIAGKKFVWTLHDMSPFTAGCQYASACDGYKKDCKACIYTENQSLVEYYFQLKRRKVARSISNHSVVVLNDWMKRNLEESSIFHNCDVQRIYNGLNTDLFKPGNKQVARRELGLPASEFIVLFIAQHLNNPRKGGGLLTEACSSFSEKEITVVTIGEGSLKGHGASYIELGKLNDTNLLSYAYQAADVLVHAAVSDNLPNTVVEALLCGTPVVAFNEGGLPDLIESNEEGLLVNDVSALGLRKGIQYIRNNQERFNREIISSNARRKFSAEAQAENYAAYFNKVLTFHE